jgi:hypothetical protein
MFSLELQRRDFGGLAITNYVQFCNCYPVQAS